jgi:enoyl-CoA hydratase
VDLILVRKESPLAYLTVNRPQVLNAVNADVVRELSLIFADLEKDPETKVVILTGGGKKAFIAGGDIGAMAVLDLQEGERFVYGGQAMISQIDNSSKVVIAMINGYALGGGLEIALGCDLRVASTNARLGFPEVRLGLFPAWGGTQRLARLVGRGIAKELIFTGRQITAEEALQLGIVNRVVPPEVLEEACGNLGREIAANSMLAVRQAKKCLNRGPEMSLGEALSYEAEAWLANLTTAERQEGLRAFLEKRPPAFQGR